MLKFESRQTEQKPGTCYQTYFSFPSPAPLPNAHAHEEKYGWLARLAWIVVVSCVKSWMMAQKNGYSAQRRCAALFSRALDRGGHGREREGHGRPARALHCKYSMNNIIKSRHNCGWAEKRSQSLKHLSRLFFFLAHFFCSMFPWGENDRYVRVD